jgi:predicted SprT family Zn-dependent metalloprotease
VAERYEVLQVAVDLFQTHGLINYSFGFDRAIRRAGLCDYSSRRITVSRHYVENNELPKVEQVILHEIAHALAGQGAGHGPTWKQVAKSIGYRFEKLDGTEISKTKAKYRGVCPNGHEHFRFKKTRHQLSCRLCSPRFSEYSLISWSENSLDDNQGDDCAG